MALFLLLLFTKCASIVKPSRRPLTNDEAKAIVSRIQDQDKRVSSFYALGSLSVKSWSWQSDADILIVGTRNPLRLKIEITHPWGQPILHILINGTELRVLSFSDRKLYLGTFSPRALSKFFPGELNIDIIWAASRGYPSILSHHRIASPNAHQIILLNRKEREVEKIDLCPVSLLPKLVYLPEQHIRMGFVEFQESNGIYYAREVKVNTTKLGRMLVLKNDKMAFNRTIPEEIFVLEKPPAFETIHLEEIRDTVP